MAIKLEIFTEVYSVLENDGSGPIPKEAHVVIISHEGGKPKSATFSCAIDINDPKKLERGPKMATLKDPEKLKELVSFIRENDCR